MEFKYNKHKQMPYYTYTHTHQTHQTHKICELLFADFLACAEQTRLQYIKILDFVILRILINYGLNPIDNGLSSGKIL